MLLAEGIASGERHVGIAPLAGQSGCSDRFVATKACRVWERNCRDGVATIKHGICWWVCSLKGAYSETDPELAIAADLEKFLVEMGSGFAFLRRQKRITVDGEDFYLDLLFYHRRLRRLVVIDLKLGRFAPANMGQMEFNLRWLKKYETQAGEVDPIGLILCSEKSGERIKVFELAGRGIRVAEYLTELPPKKVLEAKLHQAVELVRVRQGQTEHPPTVDPPRKRKAK